MKTFLRLNYDIDWGGVGSGAATGASIGSLFPGVGTIVGGLVGAGLGLFAGSQQKKQGNQLLGANQFQPNQVPETQRYNEQLARQMANQGLPAEQYANSQKAIMRNQNFALRSAQDRRSGNQLIPAIQQNTNDRQSQLDAQNAMARLNNQRTLIGVNNQGSNLRNQAWQLNERNRFFNQQYGLSLLGAGNENIIHGIDSGVASLMRGGGQLFGAGNNSGGGRIGQLQDPYSTSVVGGGSPNVQGSGLTPLNLQYNQ